MKPRLEWRFPNGHFGDPALYLKPVNSGEAVLMDCGDLSRFSPRALMKITHIFLSHCHIDHFFGLDWFLRLQIGQEKSVTLIGPPGTSRCIQGKLHGYVWNLDWDKNLEFVVVDVDVENGRRTITRFHAA